MSELPRVPAREQDGETNPEGLPNYQELLNGFSQEFLRRLSIPPELLTGETNFTSARLEADHFKRRAEPE